MSEGLKEVVSGSVAGAVGKLFEYPFDTVKVRLQAQSLTDPMYSGALNCLLQSFRNEGFLGMYKGISTPVVAAALENAVLFTSFNTLDSYLGDVITNSLARSLLCGSLSGISASFVLTPIELIKCRIQVDAASRKAHIGQIIKAAYRSDGLFGFWRGHLGTVLREGGGSAAWFGTYHALNEDCGSLLAGAAAGISYNLSLFPADSIKSRMQTMRLENKEAPGFFETGRNIVQHSGLRGLYRGSLVTCLRAGPSNAIIFTVHDYVQNKLR